MDQFWLAFFLITFIVGYLCGRLSVLADRLREPAERAPSFFRGYSQHRAPSPAPGSDDIKIDGSKYVTQVTTAGMIKAEGAQLGVTQTKQDDINAAASKLAQLKRS